MLANLMAEKGGYWNDDDDDDNNDGDDGITLTITIYHQ